MRSLALVLVATATYTVTHGFSVIDERRGLRTRELHSSVPGSSPALPPGSRVPGSSPALPPGGGIKFPGYYPKGDSRHVPEEELGFSKGLLASNDFATRCNGKVFLEKIVDYKDSSLPGADYYFLDEDNNLKAYRYPGSCGKRTFKNFWDYISISNICPDTLITDVCKDKRAFHVYMKKDSDGVRATCLIPTWTNTLPPNQAQEYCNSKKFVMYQFAGSPYRVCSAIYVPAACSRYYRLINNAANFAPTKYKWEAGDGANNAVNSVTLLGKIINEY